MRRWLPLLLIALVLGGLTAAVALGSRSPSNDRDWSEDQARLAVARVDGDRVEIRNVRNFSYAGEKEFVPRWETRGYDLAKLDSMWFMVERFPGSPGVAHTLLSYGFGEEYVAISVEIRKEKGESFSPWKGLARTYELMYVVGDERDLIGLRTHHRRDPVWLFPVKTTKENMRAAFVSMLSRANALAERPEFYNTLTSTCTSNIVRHVNEISPRRVPPSYKTILPAYSDALAHELGLLDTKLSLEEARQAFRIDGVATSTGIDEEFSRRIRGR
ncbi:MAG: DUF4105 domain-containing protein [Thermoanaerobaculia bacterium]